MNTILKSGLAVLFGLSLIATVPLQAQEGGSGFDADSIVNRLRENPDQFRLTDVEREGLKNPIFNQEIFSFYSFLKQHADFNLNGKLDAAEQRFIRSALSRARSSFEHAWKGVEKGKMAMQFIRHPAGKQGLSLGLQHASSGIQRGQSGLNRGRGHLESALVKAHQAMQKARQQKRKGMSRAGRGAANADAGRANQPNLDQLQKNFDRNRNGHLEAAEQRQLQGYLNSRPIEKFSRSLKQEYLGKKDELLSAEKGKNLQSNPINLFSKILRNSYLEQVAAYSDQALNGSDINQNGRIDPAERSRFDSAFRQKKANSYREKYSGGKGRAGFSAGRGRGNRGSANRPGGPPAGIGGGSRGGGGSVGGPPSGIIGR